MIALGRWASNNGVRLMTATEWPALTSKHLHDAKLYANRNDLVIDLYGRSGGNITEVGVAAGAFSDVLIDHLHPDVFTAIDLFRMHTQPILWGRPTAQVFDGKTQLDYYAERISNGRCQVELIEGLSFRGLAVLEDESQDLIYIDAGHEYANVKRDCEVAISKMAPGGLLVFNDYIMFDHILNTPYGIVQVVNQLVDSSAWRIVGFALQNQMFCDIALRQFDSLSSDLTPSRST